MAAKTLMLKDLLRVDLFVWYDEYMNEYAPKHRADSSDYQDGRMPNAPLFAPRRITSFVEVAGTEAATEYHSIREDLDAQELRSRMQAQAVRRCGRKVLEQ